MNKLLQTTLITVVLSTSGFAIEPATDAILPQTIDQTPRFISIQIWHLPIQYLISLLIIM